MSKKLGIKHFFKLTHIFREAAAVALFFWVIFWLLFTASGLNTVLQVTTLFMPGKLVLKKVDGCVMGPLSIGSVSYKKAAISLTAKQLTINWDPLKLFRGKLFVSKLRAKDLVLQSSAKQSEFSGRQLLEFYNQPHFPIALRLDSVGIHNITLISSKTKKPFVIASINLALHTSRSKVLRIALHLQGQEGVLNVNSKNGKEYNLQWNLQFKQLGDYWSKMGGGVTSRGSFSVGRKLPPQGNIVVVGSGLKTPYLNAAFLQSKINLAPLAKTSNFSFLLQKGALGGVFINRLNLTGKLTARRKKLLAKFSPLTLLVETAAKVQRVNIKGGFISGQIPNNLTFDSGEIALPAQNLKIKALKLVLVKKAGLLRYKLSAKAGKGNLQLEGAAQQNKQGAIEATAKISGKDFLITNTKELQIHISPELKLLFVNRSLTITGTVAVPQARIAPRDFHNVETLPRDVVFVTEEEKPVAFSPTKLKMASNIKLLLGDQVYMHIMGLKGRLAGDIVIKDETNRPTVATGALTIKDGSYTLYGQKMELTRGIITFAGGPIVKPQLNIRAERTIQQAVTTAAFAVGAEPTKVGIQIEGVVPKPKITLFSEPEGITQTDILSYLLTGQASSQIKDKQQAGLLLQAASSLKLGEQGGVTHIMDSLRKKFGLTEIGLETDPGQATTKDQLLSNTSFILGKYLSPTLYISYSIGLFENANTFRVRKKLGKRWAVQSESGSLGSGVDLLYKIER